MNRGEYLRLLGEKKAVERLLAKTPEKSVLVRRSLRARLSKIEKAIAEATPDEREPARVTVTFRGRPVVGSHGIFVEFGMKAVNGYAESITGIAASLSAPLAGSGPIPNRDQHQLIITGTAVSSFGFELEELGARQLTIFDSAVTQAIRRMQSLLQGTLGSDEELAEAIADTDRRALDKVMAFLKTVADNEAVCTVQFDGSAVTFSDVDQVRASIERISRNNLHEEQHEMNGELQGVLPDGRSFEFKLADSSQIIRGRIGPEIADPDVLNHELHKPMTITVMVRRVGKGLVRYFLLQTRLR